MKKEPKFDQKTKMAKRLRKLTWKNVCKSIEKVVSINFRLHRGQWLHAASCCKRASHHEFNPNKHPAAANAMHLSKLLPKLTSTSTWHVGVQSTQRELTPISTIRSHCAGCHKLFSHFAILLFSKIRQEIVTRKDNYI